ncbi:Protein DETOXIFICATION 44 chloroplastic [Zea mays]|uniref:Protein DETOXIFICATION 44 chloroplastic n=1 Tax=Zea mays TaxID=4577 RepID=A0A1D6LG83_MAIZE|nr:Protein DETOXIFICATION 44 chloroplastic [Zea mays]
MAKCCRELCSSFTFSPIGWWYEHHGNVAAGMACARSDNAGDQCGLHSLLAGLTSRHLGRSMRATVTRGEGCDADEACSHPRTPEPHPWGPPAVATAAVLLCLGGGVSHDAKVMVVGSRSSQTLSTR